MGRHSGIHVRSGSARRQRGFGALLVIAIFAGAAAAAGLFTFYRMDTVAAQSERGTDEALAAAKAALIAYAVSRGGPTGSARPGELPCPDTNDDGLENAPCVLNTSLIGRLPWKTLGIPRLVDSSGETLWYALSGPFRDALSNPALGGTPGPTEWINSDTRGTITVRDKDGVTVLTDRAVAVIIAPGAAQLGQNRSPNLIAGVICALTGAVLEPSLCVSNYLDSAQGINNAASALGPFIAGAPPERVGSQLNYTFNDRVAFIDTTELIPLVEMRVANEIKRALLGYRLNSDCQCYPWADTWDYSGGIADFGQNRGRFATDPTPHTWGELMSDGVTRLPSLPEWLGDNNWHNLIWYSVSRSASDGGGDSCKTCSALEMLEVDATGRVAVVFFTPGTPRAADYPAGTSIANQIRMPQQNSAPAAGTTAQQRVDNINYYLQDAANRDAAACPQIRPEPGHDNTGWGPVVAASTCDQYVTPSARGRDRDRLHVLGAAPSAATCLARAQTLAAAAPCGTGWRIDNPICREVMAGLDGCTCSSAVRTLARPPCTNNLNPGRCQTAVSQLQSCTAPP